MRARTHLAHARVTEEDNFHLAGFGRVGHAWRFQPPYCRTREQHSLIWVGATAFFAKKETGKGISVWSLLYFFYF